MLFAIHCLDFPGKSPLRSEHRPAHLAHLATLGARVRLAGPLLDSAGTMVGSLLVLEFDTAADAADFADRDPYAQAGLFERVTIHAFRQVLPAAG